MKKEKNKCDLNEIIIKKTVCCVVSTAVLFILLNVKLGINNVITYAYFILSFLAMISLIFTFPFLKYENEYRNKKICKVAFEISDFFTLFIIACCLIQAFFAFGFFRAEVDGPSMEKTFYNGDVIIGRSTSNVKNRDVIVCGSIFRRYHGDNFLPHHSRGMDEPQQCGVGTIQYRVGTCDCNGDGNVI